MSEEITEYRRKRILELEEMLMKTSLENERLRVAHLDVVKTCARLAEENERLKKYLASRAEVKE